MAIAAPPTTHYRATKPLPRHLVDHSTVCLEEQLFAQAFSLLSTALTSGTSTTLPAHLPPTQYLSLAATLVVHPGLTTRTLSTDKHLAADSALRYLRHILRIAGPRNGELDKAFVFVEKANRGKRAKTKTRNSDLTAFNDEEDTTRIHSPYAGKDSLWCNAEDFWAIVGWAFNCSVAYKHRWQRWKLWLDFMLDVLSSDLDLHAEAGTIKDSLLAMYLRPVGEGRSNKRRLMRAVLADGGEKSLAEFCEVWRGETRVPKARKEEDHLSLGTKKRKLDLEKGEYGDYFDADSDAENNSPSTTSGAARRSRSATAAPSAKEPNEDEDASDNSDSATTAKKRNSNLPEVEAFGGIESINLRTRLLALLTHFCHISPFTFLDTEDLFDLFTEFIRPLPLGVFQAIVCPAKPWLSPDAQSSLDQMLLRPLLSASAPDYDANCLIQRDFEMCYAPFPANTTAAIDNAKVSLLTEDLLRLLWRNGRLVYSKGLKAGVEGGIEERLAKVGWNGQRKKGAEEAGFVLECSGQRMRAVISMLEST